MKAILGKRKRRDAQTLVFFLLAWGTIMLLCGLAIDSGLLFLAKARLGRAVDGAALAAVGNFNRSTVPETNRDDVALIMRNFAVANFTDLSAIATTGSGSTGGQSSPYTLPNGTQGTTYTYNFNDGTQDANGAYRRYVQVILTTGSSGAITSATCNARCPVQTYFIGYATYAINGRKNVKIGGYSGPASLVDLKVSSSAVATRNPRLIMVVIDRSGSMLQQGGGASGLPPAVVQFLDFFDTSSDNIGIVSFGSNARLEMPLTTNFIIAGTNVLLDAYNTNSSGGAIPGVDPETITGAGFDADYATTGVRRMKFGGQTAADDGIRLAMEQLMANEGFNDPDVIKYMVIFTDGKWNASRALFAAPGYTNTVTVPNAASSTVVFLTNGAALGKPNGRDPGPWKTDVTADTNLVPMPSMGKLATRSSIPFYTNAIVDIAANYDPQDYANYVPDHTNDTWQSSDGINEPFGTLSTKVGAPMAVTNTTWVGVNGSTNYYTHDVDVWLQPGAVAFYYTNTAAVTAGTYVPYVSDYTNPDKHIDLYVGFGGKVDLVVPGYIADGIVYDGLDLNFPDNLIYGIAGYPKFRFDNYQFDDMWSDDTGGLDGNGNYNTASLQRQLMFRNYPNLLTGFYLFRPDDPPAIYTPGNPTSHGVEPLITEQNPPGATRPRYGLGAYYPSAGFYWPFGGESDADGNVTNAVGLDQYATFALRSQLGTGSRFLAYSINMLSTNAAPEWAGELFYMSSSGAGTNTISGNGTSSATELMQSSDWQVNMSTYPWMSAFSTVMTNEPTHNTNIVGSPSVWRPAAYNGSTLGAITIASVTRSNSATGGYVSDGAGNYYKNAMAWSGRPTHYYDFALAKWTPISDNHTANNVFQGLGYWKAREYAWHARALGVTIYTVGYGTLVSDDQQAFLAQIANATNTTAGGGSNITYNPNQPIGQQFYATNSVQISNDFYSVGQAINAALTH